MKQTRYCKECGEPLLDNGRVLECDNYDSSTYEGKEHAYISYNVPSMSDDEKAEAIERIRTETSETNS
jgi:hypothetical protein